jgi:hypothetical protein
MLPGSRRELLSSKGQLLGEEVIRVMTHATRRAATTLNGRGAS